MSRSSAIMQVAVRVLAALPALLVLVTLAFFLMRLAPGGPFDRERTLTPQVQAALDAAYHLDESLPRQYLRYMGALLRGDLGPSFQYPDVRVSELIGAGLPVSWRLGACALLLALALGCAAGVAAALDRGGWQDRAITVFALAGISIPAYVTAPLLVLVFAVALHWLPAGGWEPGRYSDLVLPVIALASPLAAHVARLMRASMLEVLQQDYIRTARAKGLGMRAVVLGHALRPALLPVLSYLGPATAALLTGSVVVEQVFGLPGIGRHFVQGALNRDYTLVLGVVAFYGVLIMLCNLAVDLLYGALDPRLRA